SSYSLFFCLLVPRPPGSTLFPYTTLFRSQERLGDDVWWGQQHADDETGHDHIGALGGQVLRRGGAGQNQQYRRNGDFKRNAEGKEHLEHEVQITADIRQFDNSLRADGGKETEHQRKDHEIGESRASVEQQHGSKQQREGQALFMGIKPGRHKTPELVENDRNSDKDRQNQRQLQGRKERRGEDRKS